MEKENNYKLLYESKSDDLDTLLKVYETEPFSARVLFMNEDKMYNNFKKHRLVEYSNGNDYSLVYYTRKYGISISNKRYSSEKEMFRLNFKNNKFSCMVRNRNTYKVIAPTYNSIARSELGNNSHEVLKTLLCKKYSWFRFINDENILTNVSFNTILTKKLFTLRKALSYEFGVSYPLASYLTQINKYEEFKYFKHNLRYLINVDSLPKSKLCENNLWRDTLKMAKVLGRTINCKWSISRLKAEHDAWSTEITNILAKAKNKLLNIGDIFLKFHKHSGYHLFKESGDLVLEGATQNHCVATYIDRVNRGYSGIYRVGDYTLELVYKTNDDKGVLYINQFRGFKNKNAPEELYVEVNSKLKDFNGLVDVGVITIEKINNKSLSPFEELFLPF